MRTRFWLLLTFVLGLTSPACEKTPRPVSTPPPGPSRVPAFTVVTPAPRPLAERLQADCPPEDRDACIGLLTERLTSPGARERIALCVDRAGRWLVRPDDATEPAERLSPDARVGDRCPGAFPYAVIGIYEPEPGR